MLLAWFLVHTQYVFHYAHQYYDQDPALKGINSTVLRFPGDDDPDYMDFAYFSFGIGTTFQVSDVETVGRSMRRIVMIHSMLSFFINTFAVALTINMIAGINQ